MSEMVVAVNQQVDALFGRLRVKAFEFSSFWRPDHPACPTEAP